MGSMECSQAISSFEGARGSSQREMEKAVYNLANGLIELARALSNLEGLEWEVHQVKQDARADPSARNSIANEKGPP